MDRCPSLDNETKKGVSGSIIEEEQTPQKKGARTGESTAVRVGEGGELGLVEGLRLGEKLLEGELLLLRGSGGDHDSAESKHKNAYVEELVHLCPDDLSLYTACSFTHKRKVIFPKKDNFYLFFFFFFFQTFRSFFFLPSVVGSAKRRKSHKGEEKSRVEVVRRRARFSTRINP
jgi:hypothetical protein